MSDSGSGPSGCKRARILTRKQVLEALDSDSEDDFDILRISDDSGSSSASDSEDEPVVRLDLVN